MTLVMDGVRRTQVMRSNGVSAMVMPMPVVTPVLPALSMVRPKPRPAVKKVHASTAKANAGVRYVTGMDGVRRAVQTVRETPVTPREVLQNLQQPMAQVAASIPGVIDMRRPAGEAPTVETAEATPESSWLGNIHWPALRRPGIAWQKPAIAFGLVATALVASTVTVRTLATPRSITAQAEKAAAVQSVAPNPSQAPAAAVTPETKPGLQKILDDFVAVNGNHFGIVVKDLKTGDTASINAGQQYMSASLYKLFVAQRIYQRIDLGQLDFGSPAGGGTGKSVESCLRVMINVSDNACGRALGTILGWGSQDQALKAEGYKATSLRTPQQTSAEDTAMLFERLYTGTLVSPSSSERFLGLLKDQRVNNRLPQGLPGGTVIAHKTGDLDGVVHDAGIVYGPKTDYLVVMTSGPWQAPAHATGMFADLSRQLWAHFEQ